MTCPPGKAAAFQALFHAPSGVSRRTSGGVSLQPPRLGTTPEPPVNELTQTPWGVNGGETPQTQAGIFLQSRDDAALMLRGPQKPQLPRKAELSIPRWNPWSHSHRAQQVPGTGIFGLELPKPARITSPKRASSSQHPPLAELLAPRWEMGFWGRLGAVGSSPAREGAEHAPTRCSLPARLDSSDHPKSTENIPGIWVGP